ncbi:MAG: hypothetical protein IPK22_11265 [Verrucomicrobiaceae bacterium]|nr:hypothetical protein [Verrucomicrobiaceae bacterium]
MKPALESFLQTLFPGRARVCGRRLPPLTLWRLACLQAIRSPFLNQEASWTLKDLLIALRAISTPNMQPPDMRQNWRDLWLLHRHGKSKTYLEAQARVFVEWLALHQLRPEIWQPQGDDAAAAREITAPILLSNVAALMEIGMTHAEAWDTAPGYASWLILAHAERHNDRVQFADPDDDTQIDQMLADLEARDESAILAQAKADLPPAMFDKWLAARNLKPET